MSNLKLIFKILLVTLILVGVTQAQVTMTTSDERINTKPTSPEQIEARIQQTISDSEKYFKQGELNLKDNKLPQAWDDFDKSIQTIFSSALNLQAKSNIRLKDYYFDLIDRIYLLEIGAKKSFQNRDKNIKITSKCSDSSLTVSAVSETDSLLIQAIKFYKEGRDEDAMSLLRRVLVSEPESSIAYLLFGKIHFRRGDKEQAISSAKTAIFFDERLIEAHIFLVKLYLENSDIIRAKEYYISANAIDSGDERVQAISRLIEQKASIEDRRKINDDSTMFENISALLSANRNFDTALVVPFQAVNAESNVLGLDFANVLSNILAVPSLCVIANEEREKIAESLGIDENETYTLATALKLAIVSKSSLLIFGKYSTTSYILSLTAKIVKVNEGRFLSEEFADGRRITRDIYINDSLTNLRAIQGQVAYQILYHRQKDLPYAQNQFIETAENIEIPKPIIRRINPSSIYDEPDFSLNNSLRKMVCSEEVLRNLQLRSLHLGMTFEEVIKIMPKAATKTPSAFEKQIFYFPKSAVVKNPQFKDIDSIQLEFFDNRIYSIGIMYDNSIKWQNLNEFVAQVEKSLNLPKFADGGYKFDGKYLFCGNYQLKVMLAKFNLPAIHFFDATAFSKISARKQEERNKAIQQKLEAERKKREAEEEKKKVFKP